ncbi:metal ABC transporter permease [Actinobacillus pleuropneumoniae]|uniref:Iron (Chelated) transport system membrane protein n=1 Tax=Actinobacillus pleuropneumoniae TaxID=715 RepID=A0A448TWT8_ACTPL|nr:metal ABC transporter permease [Actinobacillus pleuropneumoniae]EFL79566.1 iron (chelated) transport system membrane protein [Actinobacillus pleuropneumoniae serovar 2 str. 4226]EFM88510.1 Chelated iron transport system membrane protein yfeD [Actinobacillus pleuropneumoniae serovar 2 str. S1536]MEE3618794.1 metal ABC transporter permease [Actinobacillus pleuropneumoniae]UKH08451.1 metal ABC transporter permease [Actinobacillus pleuropneumoniae]UKH44888.1 metal ABC transporter permease [Acti
MNELVLWFVEPFAFEFMQTALFTAVLVASVCAILSCYLILKGWSLMGDAISHAVLPGVVISSLLGLPLAIGAFTSGLFCAISVGYLKENSRLKEDTIMGIMFSGLFALGIVLFTALPSDQHLTHLLFGNLLGVTQNELIQTIIICTLTFSVIIFKRKDFLLYCFDSNHAKVIGLPVKRLHYGLLALLALTIISTMQVVGVILVVAMLIAPGITAYQLSNRFDYMLAIAMTIAISSSALGTILSYHIDAATGPTIILIQSIVFVIVLISKHFQKRKR